jgi:phage terminase large subunit-like protein
VNAALARLLALSDDARRAVLRAMTADERRRVLEEWRIWALPGQTAPRGDWRTWLIRAGRGFGKTRAGAEYVHAVARADPGARIALVGHVIDDVTRVMIEGESGLIATARADEPVRWTRSRGVVEFAGGAVATAYSASAPEKLRGPQHHAAWCDELAKWGAGGEAAWDNLAMGLRLGERPRVLVTTTPRATPLLRRIMAAADTVETRGRTRDNPHLPDSFIEAMIAEYGESAKGRQELDGELIEDVEGALWTRAMLKAARIGTPPALARVVVGVDPPAGTTGDACGIVAAGLAADGRGVVLEDASVSGERPEGWARAVAACAARWGADRVIAEANQGGAMVEHVLRGAEATLPVRLVHASRGKAARAEPIAALYERGRVVHAGDFPALEDEYCGLVPGGGYQGPGRSPDRADACIWALSALMLGRGGAARVRVA